MQPQPRVHPGAQQSMLQGTGGLHRPQPKPKPTLGASVLGARPAPGVVGQRPGMPGVAGGPGMAILQRLMALHMLAQGGRR